MIYFSIALQNFGTTLQKLIILKIKRLYQLNKKIPDITNFSLNDEQNMHLKSNTNINYCIA